MQQARNQAERAERIQRDFDIYKAQRKPWVPGTTMAVALGISWTDLGAGVRLLEWMRQLGGLGSRPFLLGVPHDLPGDVLGLLQARATALSPQAVLIPRPFPLSQEHWPIGPNWTFTCLAETCHQLRYDFLFLEPDCVPLRPGWADAVEQEYRGCGRAYMGHHEPAGPDHQMHLAGVAVYQWETYQRIHWHEFERAWDVALGPTLVAEAHPSRTIQQVWGEWGKPPTFRTTADLSRLSPEAALFHRNKDGTLIDRLRELRRPCES